MSQPTIAIGFSPTTPAAPTGDQNTIPQSDSGTPLQRVSQYPQRATGSLFGTVKPDGSSIVISGGVISAAVTKSAIQQESYIYAADTGAANAYAVALSPAPTIVAGSVVVFKAANANTGASTIAVNGGSATAIKKSGTTALAGGEIAAGQVVEVVYDGTNFQLIGGSSSGGGGSVFFGQATVSATNGQNIVTLGSTPLAGSVEICLNGVSIPISLLSMSGAVITLSGAWSNGDLISATWATSNSTPGGIALSSTSGVIIRGFKETINNSSGNLSLSLPSGVLAGDFAILIVGSTTGTLTPPTGWTANDTEFGGFFGGMVVSKILTSADIATGVIYTDPAPTAGYASVVVYAGATGGIREIHSNRLGSTTLTSSGAVLGTDTALYFGACKGTGADTFSRGTQEGTGLSNTIVGSGVPSSGCTFTEQLSSSGSYSATVTYPSSSTNNYQAMVIVEASALSGGTSPVIQPSQIVGNVITSLTTVGSSGNATVVGSNLNVPNYGATSGGLVLLAEVTSATATSLALTTRTGSFSGAVFQTDFDDYLIEIVDVLNITNSQNVGIRLSTNGGSTYDNSSIYVINSTVAGAGVGTENATETFIPLNYTPSTTVDNSQHIPVRASLYFRNPAGTTYYKTVQGCSSYYSGQPVQYLPHAIYKNLTAVNAFQVLALSGNIQGTVRVYGLAK